MFVLGAAVFFCAAAKPHAEDVPTERDSPRQAGRGDADSRPPPATAPFDSAKARAYQASWARHLGTEVITENSQRLKLVLIPPGEFLMGCPPDRFEETLQWADRVRQNPPGAERRRIADEECPQHRVVLTRPFLMGLTEVTIGQYKQFVASTGYVTEAETFGGGNSASNQETAPQKRAAVWNAPGYAVTDDSPVTQVTWNDAIRYCNWLSKQERLPTAYDQDSKENWILNPTAAGYRLPTEAEWEYACRAGTTTQYSFGDDPAQLKKYAWYDQNADHIGAGAVGSKLPNPFGLYDMHGNAWEYCQDGFDANWYKQSPLKDPVGPAAGGRRMVRGGAWHYFDLHCRSSYRNNYSPIGRTANTGFRVVRTW